MNNGPTNAAYKQAQIGFNDMARTLTGKRRIVHIPTLLSKARITPINAMIVKAVAMEAWNAFHLCDGEDGARNPFVALIFDGTNRSRNTQAARPTFSVEKWLFSVTLRQGARSRALQLRL
jgi:hypothetical protein